MLRYIFHCTYKVAVVRKHNCKSVRLPNNISIFRAELYALVLAIEVVRRSREQNFIIFSDSKSSLEAINNFEIEVDLVQKFIKEYTLLSNSGKNILLRWIPRYQVTQVSEVMKKPTPQQKQLFTCCYTYETLSF